MFKNIVLIAVVAAAFSVMTPTDAMAASQDECSIWLCLPGGFPSGCGAAHSAMKDRIKHRKSPLPDFDECAVNPPMGSGSHMSYSMGSSAYIPEHEECTAWWSGGEGGDTCYSWTTIPESRVKGTACYSGDSGNYPPFCTTTNQYVDVFVEQVQVGETYYW